MPSTFGEELDVAPFIVPVFSVAEGRLAGLNPSMQIRAERLIKKYGAVAALDGLSWTIEPGQIVAVLGPNGAGKTTLLNALSGSMLLDDGQVLFDGQVFTPGRDDLRVRIAHIPDQPPVPRHWTPLRFIGTTLKLYGVTRPDIEDRVFELLQQLDLLEVARWSFRQLSRGQTCKAVLAAFVAADPEVWLFDEPFASGMDPRGLNCFKDYAREAVKRGRTILFTTQIVEVAEHFAQRVCILDHGRIQADEAPAALFGSSAFKTLLTHLREHPVS